METIPPPSSGVHQAPAMRNQNRSNECTPSTTSEWEWVKIRRRRPGPSRTALGERPLSSLGVWDRRTPLTLTVSYRGGPECWIEIKGRGTSLRVPGSLCLFDALSQMWGDSR
jgi:hypothetical protein